MKGTPKNREGQNLIRNWGTGLANFFKHVCDPKTAKGKDDGKKKKPVFTASNWNFGSAGGVASWGGTGGTSSAYQSRGSRKSATPNPKQPTLGGVHSWDGTSTTVYGRLPKTSDTVGSLSRGTITFLSAILGTAAGVLTGSPTVGYMVYGAVDAGMTSAVNGDEPVKVLGNAGLGGLSGASPFGSFWGNVLFDTTIDTLRAAWNGEPITAQSVGTSFGINALFQGVVGILSPKKPKKVPGGTNVLSWRKAEDLAQAAIKGPKDASSIVLGKYDGGGPSAYSNIAKQRGAQYFELDNWDELSATYSDDEIWKINQKFLDIQINSGKNIYLSHNPAEHIDENSFYRKELEYLQDNGYHFIRDGNIWKAVK